MSDNLNRVFIWCVPRTISTALLKCLSFVEGVQVVSEPYECAAHRGPDRMSVDLTDVDPVVLKYMLEINEFMRSCPENRGFEDAICTYDYIRSELLGAPYNDKKILICKDMAFRIEGHYDLLPRGFKYSFLIRHPLKVFPSWKKMFSDCLIGKDSGYEIDLRKIPDVDFPKGYGYKELSEMVEFVEKTLGQEAVIIDTDDLLADPPGVLSAFCIKMGIPYSPELLSWEAGPGITEKWIMSRSFINANKRMSFYGAAFESSCFKPPTPCPAIESLSADIQACVSASMAYYEKLHARRLKPLPKA